MNLAETVKFGRPWWRDVANKLVRAVKEATKRGQGAEGAFPPYSTKPPPSWMGAQGWDMKTYAEKKAAGDFKRQASRQTNPPDLTLTGDFLRDFKVTDARDNGATVGWPAQGAKVEWNANSGRPVSTDDQPLVPSALEEFDAAYNAELDRRLTLSAAPVKITLKL
jgi:hypothetical protein